MNPLLDQETMVKPMQNYPRFPLHSWLACVLLVAFATSAMGASSSASPPYVDQLLTAKTVKVSDHVWAIIGFPNIGIIVGERATLVVDTGLGRRNGATVASAAKQLAPHNRLFLTTTHFHPEHAAGVLGFPSDTLLIRDQVQQDEMDQHGEEMIHMFAARNEQWKSLLAGEQLRNPDETFDRELRLNLGGGVTARLLWFGATHTIGDELVFVDPDKTLISGDVVQNKVGPNIYGEGGTAAGWIAVVDEIAKLGAQHVLPDHSPIGDGSMVGQERSLLAELRDRSLALKQRGESAEQAGKEITSEFKTKYADWTIGDLTSFVKAAYKE
jgi:glyoxylase-like metal-dependent hydrolase (beta-lactamase superfamily II)